MNLYLLAGKAVAIVLVLCGAFYAGYHLKGRLDASTIDDIQKAQLVAVSNEQAKAHGLEIVAQQKISEVTHDYQTKLQAQARALLDERDTSGRLRQSLAIYADSSNVPAATGLPVLSARLTVLAKLYGEALVDGEESSGAADACQAKLTAAEGWARTVITESK